jgi:SAM-dependent methyltransferase
MTHGELFGEIYRSRKWGDGSGGGSAPEVAKFWSAIATAVIRHTHAKTVLDIGCGDGWASSRIYLGATKYIGVDPVQEMVDYCRTHHTHGEFECVDALTEDLPSADLVLLKEVTQHLSDESVDALIWKLRVFPSILHCSALAPGANAIDDGGYRPVSLREHGCDALSVGEWEHGGTKYFAELWRPK